MEKDRLVKIFAEMHAYYGSQWVNRVGSFVDGKPSDRLRISMATWGKHLANMTEPEVAKALKNLPDDYAPTPGAFVKLGEIHETSMERAMKAAEKRKMALEQKADPELARNCLTKIKQIVRN